MDGYHLIVVVLAVQHSLDVARRDANGCFPAMENMPFANHPAVRLLVGSGAFAGSSSGKFALRSNEAGSHV
jgi:hypothetical protein